MRFLLGLCLCLGAALSWAEEWKLDSTRGGIVSYTRTVPGQDMLDFRAVTRIKAPMESVVSALIDVERMPDWFYQMKETRVLSADRLSNINLYMVIEGMGPVGDRDAVVKAEIWQDPISLELLLEGHSVDYAGMPEQAGKVRIPEMTAGWRIRPISPEITEVELTGSAHPGGAIPVWAANLVITMLPRESLDQLRDNLKKRAYREELKLRRAADPRARLFDHLRFPQ